LFSQSFVSFAAFCSNYLCFLLSRRGRYLTRNQLVTSVRRT
jgi:hypothetical protein